jgi:two-component system chemotaxis sensor kinase CheA
MCALDRSLFVRMFAEETTEHIAALNKALLTLEREPDDAASCRDALRIAHTVKGGARAIGSQEIASLSHAMEERLVRVRDGGASLGPGELQALFASVDMLGQLLDAALHGAAAPQGLSDVMARLAASSAPADQTAPSPVAQTEVPQQAQPGPASDQPPSPVAGDQLSLAPGGSRMIRVDAQRFDQLSDAISELVRHRRASADAVARVRASVDACVSLLGDLAAPGASPAGRQADPRLAQAAARLAEMQSTLSNLTAWLQAADQANRDIQDQATDLRLVPVSDLLASLSRPVRDLAHAQGKQVSVVIEPTSVLLDRRIVEALPDALIHLARNAVEHGVEPPEERLKRGKPATATIRLRAYGQGASVMVEISDDGRGLERDRILRAAVTRRLITPEQGEGLSDRQAYELLFTPGFTTRQQATELSGRGMGMDTVRHQVRLVGGRADVDSTPGQFTLFRLTLPLTLAITRALVVRVGEQHLALPTSGLAGILQVDSSNVSYLLGAESVAHEGETVPLISLGALLGAPPGASHRPLRRVCLLLRGADRRVAYQVDELLDEQELLIKPLGKVLQHCAFFQGGAIGREGQVIPVLDPAALASAASLWRNPTDGRADASAAPVAAPKRILVVDDSLTTRELERSILSSAGYEVQVAADGLSASERLRLEAFDLVVADVEMPNLNGLELTQWIRNRADLAELPVVIITARESPADRRRGLEVGASAYIVKSTFEQDNLLHTVESLIG